MRQARVIFRPEGIKTPTSEQRRSINFLVDFDAAPSTPEQCAPYENPIRIWLERTHPGDTPKIVFFHPEHLYWAPGEPRCGQDILVEGRATLSSGRRYRFLLELHDSFCNCAWCRDEDIIADEHVEHIALNKPIA